MSIERRSFLGWVTAGLIGAAGVVLWVVDRRKSGDEESLPADGQFDADGVPLLPNGRPVLPKAYIPKLRMMSHRLLPEDGTLPGAATLGAFDCLLRELTRPELEPVRVHVMRGVSQMDRVALKLFSKTFDHLEATAQDEVIKALVSGDGAVEGKFMPQEYVQSILSMTLEGAYGDPCHGGNKDGEGWRSIGYIMHPPQGTCGH